MSKLPNETLLRVLANRGEMPAQELALQVERVKNDYTDFYGLSAMLHAGYMATDSSMERGSEKVKGILGFDTQDTAATLCQLALPPGAEFSFNESTRRSWHDFPISIFITSDGLLKLEQLDELAEQRKQKRFDYWFAIFIAIIAALATAYFSNLFGSSGQTCEEVQRLTANRSFGCLGD